MHDGASCAFLCLLAVFLLLVELGRELFARSAAEELFDRAAGIAAFAAGKSLGLDGGLAIGRNGNRDGFKCGVARYVVKHVLFSINGGM